MNADERIKYLNTILSEKEQAKLITEWLDTQVDLLHSLYENRGIYFYPNGEGGEQVPLIQACTPMSLDPGVQLYFNGCSKVEFERIARLINVPIEYEDLDADLTYGLKTKGKFFYKGITFFALFK